MSRLSIAALSRDCRSARLLYELSDRAHAVVRDARDVRQPAGTFDEARLSFRVASPRLRLWEGRVPRAPERTRLRLRGRIRSVLGRGSVSRPIVPEAGGVRLH